MHSYALAYSNIRFRCSLMTSEAASKNTTSLAFSTPGGPLANTRTVIEALYGGSQAQSLIAIESTDETTTNEHERIVIRGFVSRKADRPSGDRQFITVNRRPCEMFGRLSREVNSVYRSIGQEGSSTPGYPFVYLEIEAPADWVDVNLVPDKRTIGIRDEATLVSKIRVMIVSF